MQEDRRPNVAGEPLPPDDEMEQPLPDRELDLEARLLRDRRDVDGHEREDPPPRDERRRGD